MVLMRGSQPAVAAAAAVPPSSARLMNIRRVMPTWLSGSDAGPPQRPPHLAPRLLKVFRLQQLVAVLVVMMVYAHGLPPDQLPAVVAADR